MNTSQLMSVTLSGEQWNNIMYLCASDMCLLDVLETSFADSYHSLTDQLTEIDRKHVHQTQQRSEPTLTLPVRLNPGGWRNVRYLCRMGILVQVNAMFRRGKGAHPPECIRNFYQAAMEFNEQLLSQGINDSEERKLMTQDDEAPS